MKKTKKIFIAMFMVIISLLIVACKPSNEAEAPVISPATATFDKDNPTNIIVDIDLKDQSLTSIKLDNIDLPTSAYQQAVGKLTILSSYLDTLVIGEHIFVVSTVGGQATLTITVVRTNQIPVISPTIATFDKDNPANVVVDLNLKGNTVTSIKINNVDLNASAYQIADGKLTIFTAYLQPLANGNYAVVVTTIGGSATLTITVKDAQSPVVSPSSVTFDKQNPDEIVVDVDLKGETLTSIQINGTTLISSAYVHEIGKLTLLESYLATLQAGVYTIVIQTIGGTATFTLTVIDEIIDPIFVRPDYDVDFYNNVDFHNYGNYQTTIEGQWPGYGIGDPFVMRFNGMFYLYVSTLDSENGVRAWKSPDLIHWTQAQGEGLPLGYVVSPEDYTSRAAYAPEVFYFNGIFYMYMSPAGNGHYIYM